ncbi:MAG: PspC domain-containing protein [Anaerolineales bacterium]|nr:PspC domain-containing protein [Anaerolineales bacterium]MCA9931212.1 PspC domain-containing protein [Anaerolineales bacterium]
MPEARLIRSDNDKMIAGICGGLAAYIGIDSALVRALFFFLVLASGIGIPIYLILWFIMPEEGNMHKPNAEIIQNNIEEMGQTVTKSINRIGRPGTIGSILILFGFYFLLNRLGFLHWLNGGVFWPLLIVVLGIYMLIRQR